MPYTLCLKHQKSQKNGARAIAHSYLCMNRQCQSHCSLFCTACKPMHKDHPMDLLSLQDAAFLLERMFKTVLPDGSKQRGQTLDLLKKLKLIREFRSKIEYLEREIQRECQVLVKDTEGLVDEYARCQGSARELSRIFVDVEQEQAFAEFAEKSKHLLEGLEYDYKKDKLEIGSVLTRQKQQSRKRSVEGVRGKIEQVRDYSMKIIEVILHEQSDDEEDIPSRNKHYQILKEELLDRSRDCFREISLESSKNSRKTSDNFSPQAKVADISLFSPSDAGRSRRKYIRDRMSASNMEECNEDIKRQLQMLRKKFNENRDLITKFEDEYEGKENQGRLREDLVSRIIQIWKKPLAQY